MTLPERTKFLPGWMASPGHPVSKKPAGVDRKLDGFSSRTIYGIFSLLQDALFSERFSRRSGWLQGMEPRAKLLMSLMLLLTVSLVHGVVLLWLIYAIVLALAVGSRLGFWFFLKRVWLFVPLMTAVIALPATLNWVTPGEPLWVLHRFEQHVQLGPQAFPEILAVTDSGLNAAVRFVSRVAVSVSIVALLTLTTPWQKILRALRVLRVPQFFVFALGMTYRYIHLLLGLMLDLHFGRKSRALKASRWSQDQKWVASRMGYLFKRSQHLAQSVHNAMLARGFQTEPKVLEEEDWTWKDLISMAATAVVCAALLVWDKAG